MVRRLSNAQANGGQNAPRRPTRIIQFGEGNFLRGFVDWQVQKMNDAGVFDGGVAIVQPLPTGRVAEFAQQDGLYTVLIEGIEDGQPVARHDIVTVINQTVNPYSDWEGFLALADNPDAAIIVSNTTEAGIAVDPSDDATTVPPHSFPAKLAYLLARRFAAGLPGFLILPCELIDDNGPALKTAVLACVQQLGLGDDVAAWIEASNQFCSTLVDRITPGYPANRAEALWAEWGYEDTLIVKTEPFMLWAIQGPASVAQAWPAAKAGLNVVVTDDLHPYHDQKVYLLNAPHTTIAQLARLAGLQTVGQTMADADFAAFVKAQMDDEIIPVLTLPKPTLEAFAAQVLQRFANPSIEHRLADIALNSVAKFVARVLPIIKANLAAGRGLPPRACLALAGLIAIYSGRGGDVTPADVPEVLAAFKADGDVTAVLADAGLWGEDLTKVPGLAQLVAEDLAAIETDGVEKLVGGLK